VPPGRRDTHDAPLRFGEDNRDTRAPLCPPLGHGGQVWRPFLPAAAGEKGAELRARVCVSYRTSADVLQTPRRRMHSAPTYNVQGGSGIAVMEAPRA